MAGESRVLGDPTPGSVVAAMRHASDAVGFTLLGHNDLGGNGDAFQVMRRGDYLYVGHVGVSPVALSILDCSDPSAPRLVNQLLREPGTRRHKVQIVGDLLLQNVECAGREHEPGAVPDSGGLQLFSLEAPSAPEPIGFYPVEGHGVHKIWFSEPPYAHVAGALPGIEWYAYHIVDLSEPSAPKRAGLWWVPGAKADDPDPWPRFDEHDAGVYAMVHAAFPEGDRAYVACMDSGMAIVDIADVHEPRLISRLNWSPPYGGHVHTTLPLPERGLVVATSEAMNERPVPDHLRDWLIWIVDVRDERQPVTISTLPISPPSSGLPWHERPGRFGPHNLHENQPGAFQSDRFIFSTYFNAGVRLHDIGDAHHPVEVGWFVPPPVTGQESPQLNDLYVDVERRVYVTDRNGGGLYVLETTLEVG